jgi:hypothetical protein
MQGKTGYLLMQNAMEWKYFPQQIRLTRVDCCDILQNNKAKAPV